MAILNEWLALNVLFLALWAVFYVSKPRLRRRMLLISLVSAPFGLTEALFIPEYWSPPSLFNLAVSTGFDIESILYCFSTGGIIAAVASIMGGRHDRESLHRASKAPLIQTLIQFAVPLAVLVALYAAGVPMIYSAIISLLAGATTMLAWDRGVFQKTAAGSIVFTILYVLIYNVVFVQLYPGSVREIWNIQALFGVLVVGIPVEELLFALSYAAMWSSMPERLAMASKFIRLDLNLSLSR
jgi:hypothetical protein